MKNDTKSDNQDTQGLLALARIETHEKIIRFLQHEKKGKLLDIPAGTGVLASTLKESGFECYCCDINPEIFKAHDVEFEVADLNKSVPLETNFFDYITCIDGLEHLENAHNAIREFSRLLKSGGKLFVAIPNYLNIERRIKFLLTGSFTKPVSQEMFKERFNSNTAMMHINFISYPILRFMLESNGFHIIKLDIDRPKPKMILLSPLSLLIKLYCWCWPKKAKERYWLKETLSNEIFLGGNTLIIVAKKNVPLR